MSPEEVTGVVEVVDTPDDISISSAAPELRASWEVVLARFERRLRREGRIAGGLSRATKAAKEFIDWAVAQQLDPKTVTQETKIKYAEHVGPVGGPGAIAKNMARASGHRMIDEAGMTEEPQDQNETEYGDDEGDREEADEAPRPRGKRAAHTVAPQVVYVQAPPAVPRGRQPPVFPRAAPRSAAQRLLPKNDKLRVFKRAPGGKRLYINDYTVEDIGGGSLHKFIKEFIDVEFSDPSGITTYEVYEVGADDKEKGTGTPITIESNVRQPQDETLSQARDAVALVQELRAMEEERTAKSHELLDEAKKKAVGNNDMTSLMMLMMMQNMNGGAQRNDGDIALKIVEKLRGHGHSPLGDLAVLPPVPSAPVQLMPPPPTPESSLAPVVNQLLAAQLSPRPERSVIDLVKELAVIKEMFAPPPAPRDPEMVAVLRLIAEKMAPAAAPAAGIESMVGTFNKMREMVTTLAPQMNAGGLTGALQSVITPELGKALGNVIAAGIGKAQAPAPVAPQPQVDPVRARVTALREATVEQLQVQRAVELLQEMYSVPQYSMKLDPALKALLGGDVKPAQALLSELLGEVRPDLNTPVFGNKVITALIIAAGGTPPPELTSSHPNVAPVATTVTTTTAAAPAIVAPTVEVLSASTPAAISDTLPVSPEVEAESTGKGPPINGISPSPPPEEVPAATVS